MSKLLIGWAEESLVPEKKLKLQGQLYERISQYVESEISATAMAVESCGEYMIMVSADLTGIPEFLMEAIRENIARMTPEIDPMKVMVAVTHTHTSHSVADPNPKKDKITPMTAKEILLEFMNENQEYKPLVTADDSVMDPKDATLFIAERVAKAVAKAVAEAARETGVAGA